MVVAIVCAATFANAAAMQWGISAVSATPEKAAAAGWVCYFMDGSTYSTFTGLEADQVGAYVADKALYSSTTAAGRGGVIAATATSGSYSGGDSVSGYMVIFDNASATSADYFAYTTAEAKSVPGSGNLIFTKEFSATSGWQSTSVPEPTSGLLLLVGGALLALRRKCS